MKTIPKFLLTLALLALAFALLPAVASAVDTTTSPLSPAAAPTALPDQVVAWLTPVLVPILIALAKKGAPKLPGWSLPLIAPVLGFLIGVINNLVSSHSSNLWLAAGLGLLGVAVREIKEGVFPAQNGGWPPGA